jgi:hypothetical protein
METREVTEGKDRKRIRGKTVAMNLFLLFPCLLFQSSLQSLIKVLLEEEGNRQT